MDNVGLYLGGSSPESVESSSKAIMDILSAPHVDEKTKRIALKTLGSMNGSPSGNSISGCNIHMEYPKPETEQPSHEVEDSFDSNEDEY